MRKAWRWLTWRRINRKPGRGRHQGCDCINAKATANSKTTKPISTASQVEIFWRIGSSSNQVKAFRVNITSRDTQALQGAFHSVHHRRWPADKELAGVSGQVIG